MEDPLLQISFHDPRWLAAFPLTHASVLDYFALSTGASGFYDRTANNEALRLQGIHDPREQLEHLKQLTGLEYVVAEAKEAEAFYIICKQQRRGPEEVTPLAYYYCLHGVIYMTPPVSAVLNARIRNAIYLLTASFEEVRKRVRFSVTTGYSYNLGEVTADSSAAVSTSASASAIVPASASGSASAAPAESTAASATIVGLDDNVVKRAAHYLSTKFPPPGGALASQAPPAPSPASELLASAPAAVAAAGAKPAAPTGQYTPPPTAPATSPSMPPPPMAPTPNPIILTTTGAPTSAAPGAAPGAPVMSASAALAAQQAAAAAALAAQQSAANETSKRGKRKQSGDGDEDGKKKRRGKKAEQTSK